MPLRKRERMMQGFRLCLDSLRPLPSQRNSGRKRFECMNKSPDAVLQRLLEQSSLHSSSQSIDPVLLKSMLERQYGLSGHVERVGSEKGHTFRLKTSANEYLVKVSPSDEPDPVTALQIAAMRYLDDAAHADQAYPSPKG